MWKANPCNTAILPKTTTVGANNAINLSDSRLFGFVPEDHIIGKASAIWFSKEKGTGPFSGYRWGRIWKKVE